MSSDHLLSHLLLCGIRQSFIQGEADGEDLEISSGLRVLEKCALSLVMLDSQSEWWKGIYVDTQGRGLGRSHYERELDKGRIIKNQKRVQRGSFQLTRHLNSRECMLFRQYARLHLTDCYQKRGLPWCDLYSGVSYEVVDIIVGYPLLRC